MNRSDYEQMAYEIWQIVYAPGQEDKIAEIEEWLRSPGGVAEWATPETLAYEWRLLEGEAERRGGW